ncbi:DUF6884 domain-containing protein [Peribacillus frigoritolerans]|uniref:DUF6884 domain-containing protein n=1 Tax=Peribacillus frigoritolerans TaxID=450367 RepID=UPI003D03FB59
MVSANYGSLRQHDVIELYNLTLNTMKAAELKTWSELVLKQLDNLQLNLKQIDFYSELNIEHIVPLIEKRIFYDKFHFKLKE